MNNSLILTVIDLIGKRKTENLIEKGIKYIFYPCIVNEKKEDMYANNNYN